MSSNMYVVFTATDVDLRQRGQIMLDVRFTPTPRGKIKKFLKSGEKTGLTIRGDG
jgi:hypothetical protein